jgi:hypothetical protein
MDASTSTDTAARWGGILLLGLYLIVTISTAVEAWRCGQMFCSLGLYVLTAPVSLLVPNLEHSLVGISIGMLITGVLVYWIGRDSVRFIRWMLRR